MQESVALLGRVKAVRGTEEVLRGEGPVPVPEVDTRNLGRLLVQLLVVEESSLVQVLTESSKRVTYILKVLESMSNKLICFAG